MPLSKYARDERNRIIAAFLRLGVPREEWSVLVGPEPVPCHHTWTIAQYDYFKPPNFDRLEQSPKEWKALADAAWQKHRDALMERWQAWVRIGVDEPVPEEKRRRGGRVAGNAQERYEWAALRLTGLAWKEITLKYRPCDTEAQLRKAENAIRKSATDVLRIAGLNPQRKQKR
jgi:hypothetical protein